MPRVIWKGAISFGLVHVPVALYPASTESGIDFDWLDKRSMDPVGYKRVNKRTGKEIDKANIVKGVKQPDGDYVILSDEEIKAAYPKTMQTIEIETFVQAAEIPFTQLERPYYLEPLAKGEKVYALLREAMKSARRHALAHVVIQTKQHLALVRPQDRMLMLNTLRYVDEIRATDALNLPAAGVKGAGVKGNELKMAVALIEEMSEHWDPSKYRDTYRDDVLKRVKAKVKSGETREIAEPQAEEPPRRTADVIDLVALLRESVRKGGAPAKPRRARAKATRTRQKRARAAG
jgi:DNA end-binding protein Ku